eukprot:14071626-Alexandrium_andersonii.AAC.1
MGRDASGLSCLRWCPLMASRLLAQLLGALACPALRGGSAAVPESPNDGLAGRSPVPLACLERR